MIDRIVHHAEVINLTNNSYRLQGRIKPQLLGTEETQPVAPSSFVKSGPVFGWRGQPKARTNPTTSCNCWGFHSHP